MQVINEGIMFFPLALNILDSAKTLRKWVKGSVYSVYKAWSDGWQRHPDPKPTYRDAPSHGDAPSIEPRSTIAGWEMKA